MAVGEGSLTGIIQVLEGERRQRVNQEGKEGSPSREHSTTKAWEAGIRTGSGGRVQSAWGHLGRSENRGRGHRLDRLVDSGKELGLPRKEKRSGRK